MRFGRRYWTLAGVGTFLAILAVLLARPILLAGTAGLGAWLCARQVQFVRTLARTSEELHLACEFPTRVQVGQSVTARVEASLPRPTPLALLIEATPPVATRGSTLSGRTIRFNAGDTDAATAVTIEWPVAGTYAFDPAVVAATSRDGLFSETLPSGLDESVVVDPPQPTNVHVGAGGERVSTGGDHEAGRLSDGFDLSDLRPYVPGDPANRIDWKATARLADPHVRERESTTHRQTALFVDRRATLDVGRAGRTQLDYLRTVGLALLSVARDHGDSVGLYAVGDEGVTDRLAPKMTDDRYAAVRQYLHDLSPTRPADASAGDARSPADARRVAADLRAGDDAFETTLRPYFDATDSYVARVERDPLVETVRTACSRTDGSGWVVLFTDDADRVRVREAVKLARCGGRRVTVFLAPDVLFEPGEFADFEAAYERYASFERFRRGLADLDRVSAFEVGPGDRIDALLSHRRQRQLSTP